MKVASGSATRLGDLVRIRTGKLDANASSPDGVYPFFTCSEDALRIASFSYDCECVLVAGNGDLNVKYYNGKFDAYQRTYIIESVDKEALDVRYLFHFMSIYVEQLRSMSVGGVIKYIKLGYLTDAKIVIPPLSEQRRIAAILDKADELRAKRRAALAQLDTLTQSIFLDMFGDPATNPKGWIKKPFGQVCETRLGKMLDQKQQTGKHRRPYLRNANVQWFRFDLSDVFEMDFDEDDRRILNLQPGDLLICEGGEPGRAAVWQDELEECYFQKALHRARPNKKLAIAEYICWLLWFLAQREKLTGVTSATIAHLTGEKLSVLPTLLPPLELQLRFTEILCAIQAVARDQLAGLRNLDALFASLQHRAFRGEL
ncbi:MAG: restriction endonuclease subunit S [Nitrospira sp.]|nr:restriction endonuclease subunit S [Nitrospira sp.]